MRRLEVPQHIHERRDRRVATGDGAGFTLIELLAIMVLGILASVVVVALNGEAASSAQAACNADAKTVELAVDAFHSNPANTSAAGQSPASGSTGQAELTRRPAMTAARTCGPGRTAPLTMQSRSAGPSRGKST